MVLRRLFFLTALSVAAEATVAQVPLTDVRTHPDAVTHVLSLTPGEQRAVYAAEGELVFADGQSSRRVGIDGTLMSLRTSASGGFAVALVRPPGSAPLDITVFAADGSAHWSRQIARHADDRLPRATVSETSGTVVYAFPSTAEICFADATGADCTALFKDAAYSTEREVLVEFSPDGRLVAVAAQREAARPDLADADSNVHVVLFDRDGRRLWSRTFAEPSLRSLAISPSSTLAISTYDAHASPEAKDATRLLSTEGQTIAEAPFGADAFAFDSDRVLLQSRRTLAAIRTDQGTSRIVYRAPRDSQIISVSQAERTAANGGETTILTGRSIFTENGFAFASLRLLHLDGAGVEIVATELDAPPQVAPRVQRDGASTAVILDESVRFYTR